ncbi:MAG: DNA gyrase subunit A [Spirochaetes bacterium]|nr:DNA gyrase subunit A [Spirochaetota bacterium]
MKESFLSYAMSVIVARALPDVKDGLKPVHRRILHAMNERAWRHDRPFVKSAKIVGEVIGNFHPHGDVAVYDTMVRMAQDFSMRIPLIEGQGNFGSVDGDPPAAYRYTEARLDKVAELMLKDIEKDTVDMNDNFDGTRKEPNVLPAAFPNLLVNGSSGIAVGMATNIPPHNMGEIIDATIAIIDRPDIKIPELMKIVKGPDFPTAGIIMGYDGIRNAYTTGRGSITIRSKVDIEESTKGREQIIVTEIPYQVNKANLITKIADLVNNKEIDGITEIRDESDRQGYRIVICLRRDANANIILNQLYKHTQLQTSYGIIFLALVDKEPKVLDLKSMLSHYILHRKEIIYRRTRFELRKAEERAHILEGLRIALDNIEEVIKIIRSSKSVDEADERLQTRFKLTDIQSKAILDMRLQKLTSLETRKIIEELQALLKLIGELKEILASDKKVLSIVKTELAEVKEKFGDKRRTEIVKGGEDISNFDVTDLIADEEMIVTITNDGMINRISADMFKKQRRGGRGVSGLSTRKEDFISIMLVSSTHDTLLLFSNKGKVFSLKTFELPESGKTGKGKSLKGIINLASGEIITSVCSISEFSEEKAVCMVTKLGILKKISINEFSNTKKNGIIAIALKKDDELVNTLEVNREDDIIIASRMGNIIRTNLSKMRSMGRSAAGIIGMRLEQDDYIIGIDIAKKGTFLFVVSEKGYGKRIDYSNFTVKGRGGKGMAYLKITEKTGTAACVKSVIDSDEIIIASQEGMVIRMNAKDVPVQGRTSSGVRLLNIKENDVTTDLAIIPGEEE